jgi:hypothetical protein
MEVSCFIRLNFSKSDLLLSLLLLLSQICTNSWLHATSNTQWVECTYAMLSCNPSLQEPWMLDFFFIFADREMRHKEFKWFARSYVATMQWTQASDLGNVDSRSQTLMISNVLTFISWYRPNLMPDTHWEVGCWLLHHTAWAQALDFCQLCELCRLCFPMEIIITSISQGCWKVHILNTCKSFRIAPTKL